MAGKRGRPPKNRDLVVESAADLMMRDPNLGLEGALQAHGLTVLDVSRAQREAIVTRTITEGFMTDDVRREFVKAARNQALTKAVIDGNMEQIKEWTDAIAAEPGVGLTQKQGAEVTLNMDNLRDVVAAALATPLPISLPTILDIKPEKDPTPHEKPMSNPDPEATGDPAV